jgi:hypothetical protein
MSTGDMREFLLILAMIGLAAGVVLWSPSRNDTAYAYLFDESLGADTQQRFVKAVIRESGISREELQPQLPRIRKMSRDLPILLELSRESDRPLAELVELRREGLDWQALRERLKLPVKPLFEGVKGNFPPPYKEAWIEWRMKLKPKFTDEQVRELMLLHLASRITERPVADIAAERASKARGPEEIVAQWARSQAALAASPGAERDAKAREERKTTDEGKTTDKKQERGRR